MPVVLDRLPAKLRISANVEDALVRVDERDVGPVPVDVLRPAGRYNVSVAKDGYETYESVVDVKAGEEAALQAKLVEESTPVYETWWFWSGAAAIVATVVS